MHSVNYLCSTLRVDTRYICTSFFYDIVSFSVFLLINFQKQIKVIVYFLITILFLITFFIISK
jgi:hypothetical protein